MTATTSELPTYGGVSAVQEAIRCTLPSCRCECFSPGKTHLRTCDTCKHGWVAHALDKLGYRSMYQLGMHVEVVQANMVFDIASLMLYGAQATPIRLKILLDRLFSVLQHEEVLQVLHGFGWTYEDYARGYILQESSGRVLDKWSLATRDEEQVIIQQFLRFGETKSIAQEIILQDTRENRERAIVQTPKTESEIKKFIERSNMSSMTGFMQGFDARHLLGRPLGAATTPPATLTASPQGSAVPPTTNSSNSSSSSNSSISAVNSGSVTAARIMSPTAPAMSTFSPPVRTGSVNPEVPMAAATHPAVSPVVDVAGSPLTRLQGMQPFDYRRERLSPTVSPGTGSEKSLALSSSGNKTPEDLSMTGSAMSAVTSSSTPPATTPVAFTMQVNPLTITPTKAHDSADDDMSPYPGLAGSDDSQDGVINYSTKGLNNNNNSVYADRKIKHLRKSANPMKRHWQPNPTFGSTLISPSGKKRVLCTACNKTFCDKGALKIHYSAVHLKEMHKCTVEGCNMMFSSRRSRNRHSANPNPKLHMPNQKRKIPEGATVLDNSGIPVSLSSSVHSQQATPTSLALSAPPNMAAATSQPAAGGGGAIDVKPVVVPKTEPGMGHESMPMVPPEIGFYMDPTSRMPVLIPSPMKVPKLDALSAPTSMPAHLAAAAAAGLYTPAAVDSMKREAAMFTSSVGGGGGGGRSSRKRKSAIPTRCAQLEDSYAMSDDDGNNGGDSATEEENLMPQNLTMPKRADPRDGHVTAADESAALRSGGCSSSGNCNTDDDSRDGTEAPTDFVKSHAKNYEGLSLTTFHEIQAKAIKQMDCISQARLRDVCSDDFQNSAKDINDSNNNDDDIIADRDGTKMDVERNNDHSAPCSPLSAHNGSSDLESLDSGNEGSPSQINGYNGKDYMIDMGDIPIDKENPRRCLSCGKVFANLIAVKSHYQSAHLNSMYTCTVEGCNAAFPSKRSRDRHSSNLNLHRKLLSTSSSDGSDGSGGKKHDDYIPRLYQAADPQGGGATYTGSANHAQYATSGGAGHYDADDDDDNNLVINMSTRGGSGNSNNSATADANMNNKDGAHNSCGGSPPPPAALTNGDSPSHHHHSEDGYGDGYDGLEDAASPLSDAQHSDGSVKCHICRQRFRDNLVLKEHYERTHPKEMYSCTISGCDKIFSTRKSRNRHSQNDNLHRHLSPSTNGTP